MENCRKSRLIPPIVWVVCGLALVLGVSRAVWYDECYYPHPLENSLLDQKYAPDVLIAELNRAFSRHKTFTFSAYAFMLPGNPQAYLPPLGSVRSISQRQEAFIWLQETSGASLARYELDSSTFKWRQMYANNPVAFDTLRDGSLGFAAFQGTNNIFQIDLATGMTKQTILVPGNETIQKISISLGGDLGVATTNNFYLSNAPYTSFNAPFSLSYPPTDLRLTWSDAWMTNSTVGYAGVYNIHSGSHLGNWNIPGAGPLALSPNGREMAVGATVGNTGSLTFYDTRTLDKVGSYSFDYSVNAMSWFYGGSRLAIASQTGRNLTVFHYWDKKVEYTVGMGAGPMLAWLF